MSVTLVENVTARLFAPTETVLVVTPTRFAEVRIGRGAHDSGAAQTIALETEFVVPAGATVTVTARGGAGSYVLSETYPEWDDLRFPVQGINPAGTAAPPTIDEVLTSFPGTLLFSGSAENVIAGVAQMPHAWRRGSAIRPHIHWSLPVGSSAAVEWELYYRHLGMVGDTPEDWVGPVVGTIVAGDQTVTNEHLISSFGEIDMTGKKESSCINWQIRRSGDSDANSGTARLYEFDIHYQTDKSGTRNEIPD